MRAMTEMPANTPRPMGSTSSFLPGIATAELLGAASLAVVPDWFCASGAGEAAGEAGGASPTGMLVGPCARGMSSHAVYSNSHTHDDDRCTVTSITTVLTLWVIRGQRSISRAGGCAGARR